MTPAQIVSAVRDLVILLALGAVLWYVHRADENAFKVADLTAVTKQLNTNAATAARYSKEASDAQSTLAQQMAATAAAVSSQSAPVLLCPAAPGPRAVSGPTARAAGQPASPGRPNTGPRGDSVVAQVDIRPELNAFELKYEDALSSCRSVLDQWPH
jgi:hypothetical protein